MRWLRLFNPVTYLSKRLSMNGLAALLETKMLGN
jgi:hypothetical protein